MFAKTGSILLFAVAVLPWYDFKKDALIYPKTFKIYSISLVLVATVLSSTSLIFRSQIIFPRIYTTTVVMEVVMEMGYLTLFSVTVLRSSFWTTHVWQELFRRIKPKKNILKATSGNFRTGFFLGHVSLVLLFAIDIADNNGFILYYVSFFLYRYFYFLTAYVILSVMFFLSRRYRALNDLFHLKAVRGDICFLKQIIKIYEDMDDIDECFNELIGWPVLLLFFCCTVQIQHIFSFLIRDRYVIRLRMLLNVGYVLVSVVSIVTGFCF